MGGDGDFAITGCGMISAAGNSYQTAQTALMQKRKANSTPVKTGQGFSAPEPDISSFVYQRKALNYMDRRALFVLAAGQEAMRQSAHDMRLPPERLGISLAVGISSPGDEALADVFSSDQSGSLLEKLEKELKPLWLLGRLPNMPASHLSLQFKARGPVFTSCLGRQSLRDSLDAIENEEVDVVLAGAVEAWNTASGRVVAGQNKAKSHGEAAIVFVIESSGNATARGARVLRTFSRRDLGTCAFDSSLLEEIFGFCGCADDLLGFALSLEARPAGI